MSGRPLALRRLRLADRFALGLAVLGGVAVLVYVWTDGLDAWLPNVATSAWSIALTVAVVERIVRSEARDRIAQALGRIRPGFYFFAEMAVNDYSDTHKASYERPPLAFRELLRHFRNGLDTIDAPWPRDPRLLLASKALSRYLEEQLASHGSVLDHSFIAEAHTFIRSERMSRNMYLAANERRIYYDEAKWRRDALSGTIDATLRLYEAFEPHARQHLPDAAVSLRDDEIEYVELLRSIEATDERPAADEAQGEAPT
jgi:hypothetical protein